ncbi:MAG: segregation/condensation protein A [Oscillospiraceae bacterium]
MEEISFKVEKFEGPLDLMLHLISKHKLNINDIPIVQLLEQYLDYIDKMAEQDMEVAGEFLEMAARLIYIKTVSLLPSHDEANEMKKELEGKLIEYSLCKKAAEMLKNRFQGNNIFVRKQIKIQVDNTYRLSHDANELLESYSSINIKGIEREPLKASMFSKFVSKKIVSVTSKIIFVLKRLYTTGFAKMDTLYVGVTNRSEKVATFLAILELTKSGRITLSDDNSEIYFSRPKKNIVIKA